jgi:hypothetical protein
LEALSAADADHRAQEVITMTREIKLRGHYRVAPEVKHTTCLGRTGNRVGNGERTQERKTRLQARRQYMRRAR